jgi:hypothetical protein
MLIKRNKHFYESLLQQINYELPKRVQDQGCLMMSLLAAVQAHQDEKYEFHKIGRIYYEALEKGFMTVCSQGLCMPNPDGLLSLAAKSGRAYQVGKRDAREVNTVRPEHFWAWVRNSENFDVSFTALEAKTLHGEHWRLGNKDGQLIYDPRPSTNTLYEKTVVYYRIVDDEGSTVFIG